MLPACSCLSLLVDVFKVAEAAHDKCADILGLRSQSTCKLPLLQFTCLFDDCVKFVGTTDRLADKQVIRQCLSFV